MSVIIRLQNLPWSANALDIRQFFNGLSIPEGGVHIVGGELGDAFIAFSTDEDARQAFNLSGGKIKQIQIKLMLSSRTEMQKVIEAARNPLAVFMQPPSNQPALPTVMPTPIPATVPSVVTPPAALKQDDSKDRNNSNGDGKSDKRDRRRSRSKSRDRRDRDKSRDRERRRRRDRSRSRSRDRRDRRRRDRSHSRDRKSRDRRSRERSNRRSVEDKSASKVVIGVWEDPPAPPIISPFLNSNLETSPLGLNALATNPTTAATLLINRNTFQPPVLDNFNGNSREVWLPNNDDGNCFDVLSRKFGGPASNEDGTSFDALSRKFGGAAGNDEGHSFEMPNRNLGGGLDEEEISFSPPDRSFDNFNRDTNRPVFNKLFNNGDFRHALGNIQNTPFMTNSDRRPSPPEIAELPQGRTGWMEKSAERNCCIQLSPYYGGYAELRKFFSGLYINSTGIKCINDDYGKPTGIVYIRFVKPVGKNQGLLRHGAYLRGRPVDVTHLDDDVFDCAIDRYVPEQTVEEVGEATEMKGAVIVKNPVSQEQDAKDSGTCLCIDNLAPSVTEQDLLAPFSEYTMISIVVVSVKQTNSAFIKFGSPQIAKKAQHKAVIVSGKIYHCRQCTDKEFNKATADTVKEEDMDIAENEEDKQVKEDSATSECISLTNLPPRTSESDIRDFFSDIAIIPKKIHMLEKAGKVFCEFANGIEAKAALEKNGLPMGTSIVTVEPLTREEMQTTLETPPSTHQPLPAQKPSMQTFPKPTFSQSKNPEPKMLEPKVSEIKVPETKVLETRVPETKVPETKVPELKFSEAKFPELKFSKPNFPEPKFLDPKFCEPRFPGPKFPRPMLRMPGPGTGLRPPFFPRNLPPFPNRGGFGPPPYHPPPMEDDVDMAPPGCTVVMNNVPYKSDLSEILNFYSEHNVSSDNVLRRYNDNGTPSGEVRIIFDSPEEVQQIIKTKNRTKIRDRTIYLKQC